MSATERFWGKVDKSGSCWLWLGGKSTMGYGMFRLDGKMLAAHRVAYGMTVGVIPDGQVIDHVCHTRACVNPDHLRLATQKQNMENRVGPNASSKSGVQGVFRHSESGKWRAAVQHHGKRYYCGLFPTIKEAESAIIAKRNELFTHNNSDKITEMSA